jgi:hypothetical protein
MEGVRFIDPAGAVELFPSEEEISTHSEADKPEPSAQDVPLLSTLTLPPLKTVEDAARDARQAVMRYRAAEAAAHKEKPRLLHTIMAMVHAAQNDV